MRIEPNPHVGIGLITPIGVLLGIRETDDSREKRSQGNQLGKGWLNEIQLPPEPVRGRSRPLLTKAPGTQRNDN